MRIDAVADFAHVRVCVCVHNHMSLFAAKWQL